MNIEKWETVNTALKNASQYDLQVEVVIYALQYMKENPSLTVEQAITMGYDEWIK